MTEKHVDEKSEIVEEMEEDQVKKKKKNRIK